MKKKIIIVGVVVLLIAAVIGVSYAAFSYSQTGAYENTITTGEISMSYDETSKVINMNGALPTTDETGKASLVEGEYFDFSVTTHIVGDTNINWEISAKALESNTFDGSNVRLYLTKIVDGEEVEVMSPKNYSESTTSNSYTGRPSDEMSLLMGSTSQEGDVTTNYRLRMWVDEDYNPQGTTGGETFAVEINVYGLQGDAMPLPAVDTLLAKANDASITDYEAGNTGEMYTFSHEAGEQQVGWTEEELTDYRYIGAAPNNYVTFNDELWRIIGIFTVEDASGNKEQRMKIVKNESIGNYGRSSVNWAGDTLNTQLNSGDYWNTLSDAAKSQIATTKWYFGMTPAGNANNFYINERSTDVYPYSGSSANWTGNIGLIYASDYYYATSGGSNTSRDTCYNLNVSASSGTGNTSSGDWDLEEYSDCKNNNWLYKSTAMHTLSIYTAPYSTWIISATGSIHTDSYHNVNSGYTSAVYPTLYLNANTFVVSGTGTSSDPYKLLES